MTLWTDIFPSLSRKRLNLALRVLYGLTTLLWTLPSWAGVFNLPHFLNPGEFAIGLEPELVTTHGPDIGVNFRYAQGLNDLSNITGIIGSGGGDRGFRVGGALTQDFFPDVEGQPGVGIAFQGLYVKLPNAGSVEVSAIPYLHKALKASNYNIEPFISVPVGLSLSEGRYNVQVNGVLGTFFEHSVHVRTIVEVGIALNNNSYTYISGGVVYYH
jgi:hypothetical protein